MHPDTELYLHELRTRLSRERARFGVLDGFGSAWGGSGMPLAAILGRDRAARIGAFLRSLRDWPQPGRPA